MTSSNTNSYGAIEVGGAAGGYRIEVDPTTAVARVVAWGFWDVQVASSFGRDVCTAFGDSPRTRELVLDFGELKPMRDEGQHGLAEVIASLPRLGIETAKISTASQLTKLQLLRIVKSNDRTGRVRFVESGAGSGWTR